MVSGGKISEVATSYGLLWAGIVVAMAGNDGYFNSHRLPFAPPQREREMVGLAYDFLANPLGAVRLAFEKAVASSPPDADLAAAFRGKDWGAVDLFRDFLFEQGGLSQVSLWKRAC